MEHKKKKTNIFECYYDGERKKEEFEEVISQVLEGHDFDLSDRYIDYLFEMCKEDKLPKRYRTEGIIDFDKVIDDEKYLEELMMEYDMKKNDYYKLSKGI